MKYESEIVGGRRFNGLEERKKGSGKRKVNLQGGHRKLIQAANWPDFPQPHAAAQVQAPRKWIVGLKQG